MNKLFLFFGAVLLLASGCYEDRIGCLDPDATDFDELPALSLDVDRMWGDTTLASLEFLLDGAGNAFEVTRFRYYLSGLALETVDGTVPVDNSILTSVISGTDTLETEVNADLILVESTGATLETAGTVRVGQSGLTGVEGLFGTADDFPNVYPPDAPDDSPLATQEGLLNFNDGNGYLLGSLEVLLLSDSTTRRIDLTGNLPLELPFGTVVEPFRGFDLTVEIAADYQLLLGDLDLRAGEETVASGLRARLPDFLRVTGLR